MPYVMSPKPLYAIRLTHQTDKGSCAHVLKQHMIKGLVGRAMGTGTICKQTL
jgi:hypothetical protein